jgi:anti-sigma B factor antagonist
MNILNIKERQIENVTVLDMTGNIRIGEDSIALRTAIRQLIKEERHQILLNLAEVIYIDSSGLGELISGYTSLKNVGGSLKLLSLTQRVRELMMITKLLTVFDVYNSESEAIESFTIKASEIKETPPAFVKEIHHKPDNNDLGLPESPIFSNYSDQLWTSHTKHGLVQSPNRSPENTDGPQPTQK